MGLINISVLFNVDLCAILKKISCLEIHLGLKIVNTVWSRLLLIGSCFVDKISFFPNSSNAYIQQINSNPTSYIQQETIYQPLDIDLLRLPWISLLPASSDLFDWIRHAKQI